jgi:prepilin-type N-terminal cleavage/methylation domain-containing protein
MPKNKIFDFLLSSKNNNINNKGFTLAEVLIVIAIILFLFPMVLTHYHAGDRQFSLYRSAHDLAQDLRSAQEMAMTGKTTPVQFGQNFPAGGYGLYFEDYKNSYILFADCDGDNEYDESGIAASCAEASSVPGESYPEKIRELSLESGVIILSITPSSPLTILFFPPIPVITIKPQPSSNEAVITLMLEGKSKVVTINTLGLIDVD